MEDIDNGHTHGGHTSGKFAFKEEEEKEHTPLVNGKNDTYQIDNKYKYSKLRFVMYALSFLKKHMKAIKIGLLFIVLLLGIIAFASAEEPEVDNTFALDSDSPLISLLL